MSSSTVDLAEAKSARVEIAPRYVRIPEAELMFGIRRSKLLTLARKGLVTSMSVCDPGSTKGVRLFEVASLDAYIKSFIPKEKGGAE